jgi:hypothetical protein
MIDDLTIIHQLSDEVASKSVHMFKPMDAYRIGGGFRFGRGGGSGGDANLLYGENKPGGAVIYYNMKEAPAKGTKVSMEIYRNGEKIETSVLKPEAGLNSYNWNMMFENAENFDGNIMWAASLRGPMAPPGEYTAKLIVGDETQEQNFKLLADPRYGSTDAELVRQFDFLITVRDKLTETHRAIKDIRETRSQMNDLMSKIKGEDRFKEVVDAGKALMEKMTVIEEALYQTKNESGQDPLNFPIRLNNKLAALNGVVGSGHYAPTAQAETVRIELTKQIDAELAKLINIMQNDLPAFNELVKQKSVDAIVIKKK